MNFPRAFFLRSPLALGFAALLLGCGASEAPTPAAAPAPSSVATEVEQAAPAEVQAPVTAPAPAPGPASESDPVVVRELTLGDRACYLQIENAQGVLSEEMGEMSLCERTELVGRTVLLTFGMASVAAESCQGDPECSDTESVSLVQAIDLVP